MTFFNIYSSEKTPKKEKVKIIIDYREKNSLVPSELMALNFEIQFQQLPLGDYIVNNTIIERKTLSDLQASIMNKRIFFQLTDLSQTNSLLIIEGNKETSTNIIHPNALKGFLLSLSTEYKVPFIFSENEKDTALYISLLARKPINKEISLRQTRSFLSEEEQKQFILEGFPGIGPSTAKKLLKEFKSLKNIFNASQEDLEKIIGKKAFAFFKILNIFEDTI
ncbi:MAG: ERCC4 domain-containing protein [Nanoarchaeota archaeon]